MDIGEKIEPVIRPLLAEGETLRGMCVGSRQGLMSGKFVVIAVTDRRLIVQETDRKQVPKGEPLSLAPEQIASARVGGAGGMGGDIQSGILNKTSLAVKLKTAEGEKLKLMLARGGGPLGGLMGGPTQENGARALTDWLAANVRG